MGPRRRWRRRQARRRLGRGRQARRRVVAGMMVVAGRGLTTRGGCVVTQSYQSRFLLLRSRSGSLSPRGKSKCHFIIISLFCLSHAHSGCYLFCLSHANSSFFCSNWIYSKGVRIPNGLITVLLKLYWPGLYCPDPVRQPDRRVLATSWDHWEAALHADHGTHAKAMITTFWVSSLQKHKSILVS